MALRDKGSSVVKIINTTGRMLARSDSFSRSYKRQKPNTPQQRNFDSHRALQPPALSQSPSLSLMAGNSQAEGRATPEFYEYAPFTDGYSIRILTLAPGTGDQPLAGYLTVENLDYNPEYEAVSYVWGAEDRCSEILLNDKNLPLTHSIHGALQRMRHPTKARRLWADQICINQHDIAERSQQVGLMNAIYKGAKGILVWLGADTDNAAQDAVNHLRHLHEVFNDELAHEAFKTAHSEQLMRQSKELWVPFSKLTKLPWVSFSEEPG